MEQEEWDKRFGLAKLKGLKQLDIYLYFYLLFFCGLNRIGFHHIDLKGPSDIIKSIKRCSSIFPYIVVMGAN